jgi:hypothetical protein
VKAAAIGQKRTLSELLTEAAFRAISSVKNDKGVDCGQNVVVI